MNDPKRPIALRIDQQHVAQIDRLAAAYGLSRTAYMVAAALQKLPNELSTDDRIDDLTARLERLEQIAFNG